MPGDALGHGVMSCGLLKERIIFHALQDRAQNILERAIRGSGGQKVMKELVDTIELASEQFAVLHEKEKI